MTILGRNLRLSIVTTVATSLLCGGVLVGLSAYSPWGLESFNGTQPRRSTVAGKSFVPRGPGPRNVATAEALALPAKSSSDAFSQFDKIIVDIEDDGSIRVFGESMDVAKLCAMLSDQLTDHAKTMVTIRPDENCVFRHIEQVIQVCDDCKIHHQTVATEQWGESPAAAPRKKTG